MFSNDSENPSFVPSFSRSIPFPRKLKPVTPPNVHPRASMKSALVDHMTAMLKEDTPKSFAPVRRTLVELEKQQSVVDHHDLTDHVGDIVSPLFRPRVSNGFEIEFFDFDKKHYL